MRDDPGSVDVHQHLWPEPLVEALRRRSRPPFLRGWTLHTLGEAPYDVCAADHDAERRAGRELGAGRRLVLVSLSTPLGIEDLPETEADALLAAWHDGALDLPSPFGAWAAARTPARGEPHDLDAVDRAVERGFVGLQLGAHLFATPGDLERQAPLLRRWAQHGLPVLVHPGPVPRATGTPSWWPAVHQYAAQLQAAWWSWTALGRCLVPDLRICFAAGAGLAPLHHERHAARGGTRRPVDPEVFVETSSYGTQGIDALSRALGIDALVLGSDRPYAEPADDTVLVGLGDAALHAVSVTNPTRLLEGVSQ